MPFTTNLLDILSKLGSSFHPDELAYLAATSKVEGPIRDKIAFSLHKQLDPDSVFVHREWRDPKKNGWIDIAITDKNNHPQQLIELKAHSGPTFEAGYSEKIRLDLQKLYKASDEDTELYILFLFNHLFHPELLDPSYRNVVKYFDLQNYASRTNLFAVDVRDKTKEHWERHLQRIGLPLDKSREVIQLGAGRYHRMPMSIHIYVLGSLRRHELEPIFDPSGLR